MSIPSMEDIICDQHGRGNWGGRTLSQQRDGGAPVHGQGAASTGSGSIVGQPAAPPRGPNVGISI